MNAEARAAILVTFESVLPRGMGVLKRQAIMDAIKDESHPLHALYEAASYAGWCRGYAEGDGYLRMMKGNPQRWNGDIESMSDGMAILITAGELRHLLKNSAGRDTCVGCGCSVPKGNGLGWSASDEQWTDRSQSRPIVLFEPLCWGCMGKALTAAAEAVKR